MLNRYLALTALLAAGPALAQPALFVPAPEADLAPRQAAYLGALQGMPAYAGGAVGRVAADRLLGGSDVTVALPDGATVTLQRDRVERRAADDASWFGRGDAGASGVFVVREGGVTGTVIAGGRLYTLRPLGGGLHALARLDEAAFQDHGDDYAAFQAAERQRLAQEAPPAPTPGAAAV